MKHFFKRLVIVGLSLTLILPLVMTHTVSASTQKPIKVVTGLNFYGEVAKAVAGNQGKVTSFINNSSVDPMTISQESSRLHRLNKQMS